MASTPQLTDYPRPNVAVDLALLTVLPGGDEWSTLAVLLQERSEAPRGLVLPGRFLRENQSVEDAVTDLFRIKIGFDVGSVEPEPLGVYSEPGRDDRGWTISLAHTLVLRHDAVGEAHGRFVPVNRAGQQTSGGQLLFDHDEIVGTATRRLREQYELTPDPAYLIGDDFTLGELRALHEAVLGEPLRRDTFNRRMAPQAERTDDERSIGGRPGRVYRRRAVDPSMEVRRLRLPRAAG